MALTKYEALLKKLNEAADEHPDCIVVLTKSKLQLFPGGDDPHEVMARINETLKDEKESVIFKKPEKETLVIL